jgi:hypothetical protein
MSRRQAHAYSRMITLADGVEYHRFLIAYAQLKRQSKEVQEELLTVGDRDKHLSLSALMNRVDATDKNMPEKVIIHFPNYTWFLVIAPPPVSVFSYFLLFRFSCLHLARGWGFGFPS